jgi:hypothetical protein
MRLLKRRIIRNGDVLTPHAAGAMIQLADTSPGR